MCNMVEVIEDDNYVQTLETEEEEEEWEEEQGRGRRGCRGGHKSGNCYVELKFVICVL